MRHVIPGINNVFHYFLLYDSKKDAATTATHSKHIMEPLHNRKVLMTNKSTIWENAYVCADK